MPKKDANKPKGRMTAYAFFIQTCREEHKKKHPNETVQFSEFSKKCSEKWKEMGPKEKKRFEDMAGKDKIRYDKEMKSYVPPADDGKKGNKRKKKDPNAPKRPLSAFFLFCNEERPKVRKENPGWGIGDVAKEMAKRWEACTNRTKFDALNVKAKERYEKEMAAYKKGGGAAASSKGSPAKKAKKAPEPEPEEDDDEDEEEEEDDDDDEEEDE